MSLEGGSRFRAGNIYIQKGLINVHYYLLNKYNLNACFQRDFLTNELMLCSFTVLLKFTANSEESCNSRENFLRTSKLFLLSPSKKVDTQICFTSFYLSGAKFLTPRLMGPFIGLHQTICSSSGPACMLQYYVIKYFKNFQFSSRCLYN